MTQTLNQDKASLYLYRDRSLIERVGHPKGPEISLDRLALVDVGARPRELLMEDVFGAG